MAVAALAPASPPLSDDKAAPGVEAVTVTAQRDPPPKPFSQGELSDKYQQTEQKLGAINEATGGLQPPKWDMPKPPEPKQTDAGQAWGSAAMMLAAMGSLMTRTPLTTALNSAAAVMKAAKANDLEEANRQFEVWKTNSELAIKQQNFQMEAYKAALAKANTDSRTALAEFTAYAHAFGDNTAIELGKQRNMMQLQHLMLDREKLTNHMQENMPKMIEGMAFVNAYKSPEFQKKLKDAPTAEEKMSLIAGLHSGLSQEDMDYISEQRLAGDTTAYQNIGRGAQGAAALMAIRGNTARMAREKGMNGADLAVSDAAFMGIKAGYRTADVTAARIGLGVSEMKSLVPQVRQASEELKRGNYEDLNSLLQAAQKKTASPELRNLAVRLQGLKSAFSQVLTRGGVPTDSARASADELFSTKDPGIVLDAALSAMKDEARAIEKAPGDVRRRLSESVTGKKRYASPDAVKKALQAKEIDQDTALDILQEDFGFEH